MSVSILAGILFSVLYSLLLVLSQKFVRGEINPIHLNFFSYTVALLIILIVYALNNKIRNDFYKINIAGLRWGLLTGVVGSVVADGLILFGFLTSSAVNWSLLSRLILPSTFLMALSLKLEQSGVNKWISLLISIFGVYLLVTKPGESMHIVRGDLYFLVAILMYSLGNIFTQFSLQTISPGQLLALRVIVAVPVWGIITFLFARQIDINLWWYVIFNGISILVGIWLANFIISKSGASFFSLIMSLVPLFTVILAIKFFGEFPNINQLVGGVLVVASVFIFQLKNFPIKIR